MASHPSVGLYLQQEGQAQHQNREGPTSLGLSAHRSTFSAHSLFGHWENISRRSPMAFTQHEGWVRMVNETFGVPKAGSPSFHGEGRSSCGVFAFCHLITCARLPGNVISYQGSKPSPPLQVIALE